MCVSVTIELPSRCCGCGRGGELSGSSPPSAGLGERVVGGEIAGAAIDGVHGLLSAHGFGPLLPAGAAAAGGGATQRWAVRRSTSCTAGTAVPCSRSRGKSVVARGQPPRLGSYGPSYRLADPSERSERWENRRYWMEWDEGSRSLYGILSVVAREAGPATTPDTIMTKTIETVDNDRATALMPGVGVAP